MESEKPRRHRLRLEDYDYSQNGAYFVTICIQNRTINICDSPIKEIFYKCWLELPNHYDNIILDEFIVMPNHVHGIIFIDNDSVGAGLRPARSSKPAKNLFEIVRAFKSFSSREYNKRYGLQGNRFWQRNYFERVIRNEKELKAIREYIRNNPMNWEDDQYDFNE
jgi:putative transposase